MIKKSLHGPGGAEHIDRRGQHDNVRRIEGADQRLQLFMVRTERFAAQEAGSAACAELAEVPRKKKLLRLAAQLASEQSGRMTGRAFVALAVNNDCFYLWFLLPPPPPNAKARRGRDGLSATERTYLYMGP